MKIDIITIFPEIFDNFIDTSIIKKAIDNKKIKIKLHNLRDYSKNKHNSVDDTPYGGGFGMLMTFPPIYRAIKKLRKKNSLVILLSPKGETYKQSIAKELSKKEHIIFICGRYEGVDERVRLFVDLELSIGDYVLMGGEIPAMAIIETVTRLIPGVIKEESFKEDSFENNLLEYPQYTKPSEYKGYKVPDVLLSGDHLKIKKWRFEKQLEKTEEKRPDLLKEGVVPKWQKEN